jgi:outer membrane protein insertion porin family
MFKKISVLLVLLVICIVPGVFAEDPVEGQWWLDKPIYSIRFEGLVHADENELREITNEYLGKRYSSELFSALQSELFNLQYFAYFSAQAEKGGESGEELIIVFEFVELPIISSLDIVGNSVVRDADIEEVLTISGESFATSAKIKANENSIRELYLAKGFTSVEVTSDLKTDTETNTIALTITIVEGLQSKISAINFSGNEKYSENTLRRIIVSRQQSLFNPGNYIESNIQEDREAIQKYYRERGFIDISVANVIKNEVEQDDAAKNMLELTYVIEEGNEWVFGDVEFEGNEIFTDDEIRSVFTISPGRPLNVVKFQESISSIAKLYWNDGYVTSNIETTEERDEENGSISYTISIREGVQSVVEDVIIQGQEKTKDFVLYRELNIASGDIFSIDKLLSSMQNIYNTGIISDVSYDLLYGTEENSVIIEISVVESNKVDLEFGATFGGSSADDFPVSGFFSWTDKNFLGNGQDFSISMNVSPSSQTLSFAFEESWLMNQRWSGGISLSAGHYKLENILQDIQGIIFSEDDYNNNIAAPDPYESYEQYQADMEEGLSIPEENLMSYDQYKFTLGLSSGYTFHTDVGRLTLGGNTSIALSKILYDDTLYRPYNPIIRANLDDWQFNNKIGLNFSWDGRDLIENTTTGFLFQETVTYAGGILGGGSNYIKNSTGLSGFVTLFELPREDKTPIKGVLSAKTTVSMMLPQFYYDNSWGWGLTATQAEKLYIDGMNVARGKSPDYNLEFLWDNALEFSMPIAERILWGEIYISATGYKVNLDEISSMDISDYYFSTGAGIRLAIPGFPLGLYLTKNFNFDKNKDFHWVGGDILKNQDNEESGLKLVLAITTNLY